MVPIGRTPWAGTEAALSRDMAVDDSIDVSSEQRGSIATSAIIRMSGEVGTLMGVAIHIEEPRGRLLVFPYLHGSTLSCTGRLISPIAPLFFMS
jgi:hypothetical protein